MSKFPTPTTESYETAATPQPEKFVQEDPPKGFVLPGDEFDPPKGFFVFEKGRGERLVPLAEGVSRQVRSVVPEKVQKIDWDPDSIESCLSPNFEADAKSCEVEGDFEIPMSREALTGTKSICRVFESFGGRALLVGGCVRDAVLNKEMPELGIISKDYDFEVYGFTSESLLQILAHEFGKENVFLVGEAFGVYKVRVPWSDEFLDFSIPRRDSKVGEGHRGIKAKGDPTMTISEAARRRDLTFNTFAYDPLFTTLYDPFDGLKSIKSRELAITDEKAFQEDPLRVLRVMQFAGRFDFSVSPETVRICKKLVKDGELKPLDKRFEYSDSAKAEVERMLVPEHSWGKPKLDRFYVQKEGEVYSVYPTEKGISAERITEEFAKLLIKGKRPSRGLEFLREIGFIEKYLPEVHSLTIIPSERRGEKMRRSFIEQGFATKEPGKINIEWSKTGVPQEKQYHPEGNLWVHTLQVLDAMSQIVAREHSNGTLLTEQELEKINRESDDGERAKLLKAKLVEVKLTLMLAALCHDFGKPATTEHRAGGKLDSAVAWRSYGHEPAGVAPTRSFLARFKGLPGVSGAVSALVAYHLEPKNFWKREVEEEKPQKSALLRRWRKLKSAGTTILRLSLVAEADQRGRRPKNQGTHPLEREEVEGLDVWQDWLKEKLASPELRVKEGGPPREIQGKHLTEVFADDLGGKKGATWFGPILELVELDQWDNVFDTVEDGVERARYYKKLADVWVKTSLQSGDVEGAIRSETEAILDKEEQQVGNCTDFTPGEKDAVLVRMRRRRSIRREDKLKKSLSDANTLRRAWQLLKDVLEEAGVEGDPREVLL